MINVLMIPDWRGRNPYQARLAEGIQQAGVHVRFDHPPKGYFKLTRLFMRHSDVSAIHIHWITPLVGNVLWTSNKAKVNAKLGLLAADLILCRVMGRRVVWTIHNLVSHDSRNPKVEIKTRRLLLRLCHATITHSREAKTAVQRALNLDYGSKIHVIPHGHYIDDYSFDAHSYAELRHRLDIDDGDFVILFFGEIRPYKGVENLLEAFLHLDRPDARLVIAGHPWSEDLKRRIEQAAEHDARISADLFFIADRDVASYFHLADVVLLPFRKTLSSGSTILAMGFGKLLILPDTGRVLGLQPNKNALFYSTNNHLRTILRDITKDTTHELGVRNFEMISKNTWTSIGAQTTPRYIK